MKWLIEEDAQIHSPGAWASRNEETARVLRLYLSAELVELYCAFPTASHCFFNVSLHLLAHVRWAAAVSHVNGIRKHPEYAAISDDQFLVGLKTKLLSVPSRNWTMHLQLMATLKETCNMRSFGKCRRIAIWVYTAVGVKNAQGH